MRDDKLIKRCQRGEKEAFEELIKVYHPYVYGFLLKNIEDKELTEDLTQDTFLKIIRNIDKFDIEGKANFSTYIITVARNCYIDYLRKYKNVRLNVSLEDIDYTLDENIEEVVIDRIESKEVLDKLKDLPEEQQIAIRLKYIQGLTLKEIGQVLHAEPKTIKSRIHNGIAKLRKLFKEEDT